jgi:hypothetical protein
LANDTIDPLKEPGRSYFATAAVPTVGWRKIAISLKMAGQGF